MFCQGCGARIPEGAAFCQGCGERVKLDKKDICPSCGMGIPKGDDFCINCGTAVNRGAESSLQARRFNGKSENGNLIGFSDRFNSPEILEAAKKSKKSCLGCMWISVFVPLIGFPIAGLLMDDFPFMESLIIGGGLSFIILIVGLIFLRGTKKSMWDGRVVNKSEKECLERRGKDDNYYRTYMEYKTFIRTDAGKKKTIVEKDSGRHMYDYLAVGDKVRYHPSFGTYEKYDKSKDRIIYCNVCSMMNPIQNDRCKRCNNLLFK